MKYFSLYHQMPLSHRWCIHFIFTFVEYFTNKTVLAISLFNEPSNGSRQKRQQIYYLITPCIYHDSGVNDLQFDIKLINDWIFEEMKTMTHASRIYIGVLPICHIKEYNGKYLHLMGTTYNNTPTLNLNLYTYIFFVACFH